MRVWDGVVDTFQLDGHPERNEPSLG
jgi:hypothetical protein